jgi:hypothetical protein
VQPVPAADQFCRADSPDVPARKIAEQIDVATVARVIDSDAAPGRRCDEIMCALKESAAISEWEST